MRLLQTLQRRARQRLRAAEPSPRHSPKPPCVSDRDHRSNAPLAIGIALGLALGHAPPTLWAQSQTSINSEAISVNYGRVTQHYQTRWSDPTLPAGVLRGQPPSVLSNVNETGADATSDVEAGSLSPSAETADQSGEDAVLYVLDLGVDGMTMAVSTKHAFKPGDCVAVEQANDYLNLRGINRGFCNPDNQATLLQLRPDNIAAAKRCRVAREQLLSDSVVDNPALNLEAIGMLCDGS